MGSHAKSEHRFGAHWVKNKKSDLDRGFINYEFDETHFPEFLRTVSAGIAAGKILYREDIPDGIENAPAAFMAMLESRNFGKALVRVAR